MITRTQSLGSVAAAAALLIGGAAPLAAADFYAGKTLNVVTGSRAGGGADTTFRTLAPYLTKYIPGNPKIVVRNQPGGGGQKAWNFVYEKARPDGMTIIFSAWNPVGRVTKSPGLRADYTKMGFLAGQGIPRMSYIATNDKTGVKVAKDILTAKNLVLGGNRPNSVLDLSLRISLEMLGVNKYVYVPGLNPPRAYKSFRTGEINLTTTGVNFYRNRVQKNSVGKGEAIPLWYYQSVGADGSLKDSPHIKDMPSIAAFYKQVKGKAPTGLAWESLKWLYVVTGNMIYTSFTPPGAPKEAIAALREGYTKASKDPEYAAKLEKIIGIPPEFVSVAEGEAIVRSVDSVDPEILKYVDAWTKRK